MKRSIWWWMTGVSFIICHLAFSVSACSSIDCPVKNTVAVYYDVKQYDEEGELVTDTLKDTLWVWSRRVDGQDTLLNRLVGNTRFSLPISYQHPEDMFVFLVADTAHVWKVDTVWVKKDDYPHFESVDCPARFFHKLTGVRSTHTAIDTIVINEPSVTFDPTVTNFRIFFK